MSDMRESQRVALGVCLRHPTFTDQVAALLQQGYRVSFQRVQGQFQDPTSAMFRPADYEVLIEAPGAEHGTYVHVASATNGSGNLTRLLQQALIYFAEARW